MAILCSSTASTEVPAIHTSSHTIIRLPYLKDETPHPLHRSHAAPRIKRTGGAKPVGSSLPLRLQELCLEMFWRWSLVPDMRNELRQPVFVLLKRVPGQLPLKSQPMLLKVSCFEAVPLLLLCCRWVWLTSTLSPLGPRQRVLGWTGL